MRRLRVQLRSTCWYCLSLAALMVPVSIQAETWQVAAGAQNMDKARQVLAFLPNEIWIHAGDTVNWTVGADEIHTVTFLTVGQVRLPFFVGCPGFSVGATSFDGSTCVSTPPMVSGQTFRVMFPTTGNFKLVCFVHPDMTGVVHVLDPSTPLPHDQSFYDKEAADQAHDLLAELNQGQAHQHAVSPNAVIVGAGKTLANGGGHNTISLMRFVQPELVMHAGDTAEWPNDDPSMPHTITFGTEPQNPFPPSPNVIPDSDYALHATISSISDTVHSGFIVSASQDQIGSSQTPRGTTRFRITFTNAGIYPYKCALHDNLGMVGRIIVLP